MIVPRYLWDCACSITCPLIVTGSGVLAFFLKSIAMSLVLVMLMCRWESSHHFTKLSTTGPWLCALPWSRLTITESSAYFKMRRFLKVLWPIFVYKMNNKGDNTHPCGEPVEEHTLSDKAPLTLTLCVLFVRKFKIQPTGFLLRLKCSKSLCVKMCGCIVCTPWLTSRTRTVSPNSVHSLPVMRSLSGNRRTMYES